MHHIWIMTYRSRLPGELLIAFAGHLGLNQWLGSTLVKARDEVRHCNFNWPVCCRLGLPKD